jgi:enoyl-CoA hydratase/carnithine racemase
MSLAGLRLDADAALHAGLLVEVVDADQLVAHAQRQAAALVAADPHLLRSVRALYANVDLSLTEALCAERNALEQWRLRGPCEWSV